MILKWVGIELSDIWSTSESGAVVGRDEVACVEKEISLRDVDPGVGRNRARWHTARPA